MQVYDSRMLKAKCATYCVACLAVILLAVETLHNSSAQDDNDKKALQNRGLDGRWTLLAKAHSDCEAPEGRRMDLEVKGDELSVFIFRNPDNKEAVTWSGSIKIIKIEAGETVACGAISRLKLDRSEVYFDFVDDKLIVVGRIGPHPFDGLQLSGEYCKVEKSR